MNDSDEPPIGARFSHVYLKPATLSRDSKRFRQRIAGAFTNLPSGYPDRSRFQDVLKTELGIRLRSYEWYEFEKFFTEAELRDVLAGC